MNTILASAAAVLFLTSTGCAAKSEGTPDPDAGEDGASPSEGDANTHPTTPAFDGGTGACAVQQPALSCLGPEGVWCEESWTVASRQVVEQCYTGTLITGQGCPTLGRVAYCIESLDQVDLWGDVTYYYTIDPNLAMEPSNCTQDNGIWCQ